MSRDIQAILASPADVGFEFISSEVRIGGQGDKAEATYTVPLIRVTDVPKFEAEFPGVILSALDGTSIRVACQRVTRDACEKDPGLERKPDELRIRLIQMLKGVRVTTPRAPVFAGPEGVDYPSREAAAEAWKSWAAKQ